MTNNCKICKQHSELLFSAQVLNKYDVRYFQCNNCGFIQTEEPFWLSEAYTSPIALIDVGLLYRNISLGLKIPSILDQLKPFEGVYLDYGGGYGTFVRLMRDKGYNFFLSDLYTENLFAKYFEIKDANIKSKFTCLTAFEVFEHLSNPIDEIAEMFTLSDSIIFSTELQPSVNINSAKDWWYFVPEAGQHVSFYSIKSLEELKKHFSCYLYTDNNSLHILSRVPLSDPFATIPTKPITIIEKIANKFFRKKKMPTNFPTRASLLMHDFELYKKIINDGSN